MAILKRRLNDTYPNDDPQDEPPPKTAKTTRTRNHRLQECTICASDLLLKSFPPKLGHRTPNTRHSTCSACWQQHLATQITADKPTAQITCPQCPYVLREVDIKALGSAETHAAYLDKMFQEAMQADPSYRSCPSSTCTFGYILTQDDDQSDSIFNCRVCQAQYCVRCEVPMHRGQTCEAYQAETNSRDANEDEEASRVFLEEYAKVCPKCGVRIRKNGGCDHMTCRKCKHEFCWLCFAAYKGAQGIHTIGNGAHEGTCRYHPDILHRRAFPILADDEDAVNVPDIVLAAPAPLNLRQLLEDDSGDESIGGALARAGPRRRRAQQNQPPVRDNRPARLFGANDTGDENNWAALARAISPGPRHAEPPETARGSDIRELRRGWHPLARVSTTPEPQTQTPRAASPALSADYDPTPPTIRASMSPEPQPQTPRDASPAPSDASEGFPEFLAAMRASLSPEPPIARARAQSIDSMLSAYPPPEPQQPQSPSLSPLHRSPMPSPPELSPLGRPSRRRRAVSPQPQTPPGRRNAVAPQSGPLFSGDTPLQQQNAPCLRQTGTLREVHNRRMSQLGRPRPHPLRRLNSNTGLAGRVNAGNASTLASRRPSPPIPTQGRYPRPIPSFQDARNMLAGNRGEPLAYMFGALPVAGSPEAGDYRAEE